MLGASELPLRQGFACAKRLYGAKAPPRCAGPRFGRASVLCEQSKKEAPALQVLLFWIPEECNVPGGNEFALRRGFDLQPKRSQDAKAPPHRAGPRFQMVPILFAHKKSASTDSGLPILLFALLDLLFPEEWRPFCFSKPQKERRFKEIQQ